MILDLRPEPLLNFLIMQTRLGFHASMEVIHVRTSDFVGLKVGDAIGMQVSALRFKK